MSKSRAKFGIFTLAFILLATNAISPAMASISAAFPDASATAVQMVLLLPQLVSVPFTIFGGAISRYFSKKRLILIGLVLFSVGGLSGGLTNSVPVLMLTRVIYGIGYGLLVPCSLGIASDIFFGTEEYDNVVGMEYSLKSIGSIFYTLIAGVLCAISWRHTFLLYLTGVIVFVIILIAVPDIPPERKTSPRAEAAESVKQQKKEKGAGASVPAILIPAILIGFMYSFCIQANNSHLSYLVEYNSFGNSTVSGLMASLCTLAAAGGAAAYSRVLKVCGDRTFLVGIAFSVLGLFFGGTAVNLFMVILCVVCLGMGLGMTNPALLMLVGRASKESAALYFSLVTASMNLAAMLQGTIIPSVAAAIFGGDGLGKSGYMVAAIGCAFTFLCAIAMIIRFGEKKSAGTDKE